ncbi:MAG: hydrogenase maturation protease [Arcobacter sp.]|jgi:hydrogenase maturation protease|uniref:[Ni-Fe] hydrogenase maturation protease n=1 Tax=Arcobacter defluvii TaxID=873191 RepID=A0AAE7E732_9BACT|nr:MULTISPECIES: hydrogenase maturation protease [Arcobacter]MDY3201261.1 hydrogenase maturation protease [Arcobacter sp.]QKF77962.1 [Ni-Fe] hydrogenase maturation protease [Arcobacter defluvii]RXI32740.1 Ni/Fe hydrogenase [Arcobacter defluvii]BAK73781.1 Ni/Fe hydrogenase expression/formation protein [Arcobacter sp. L]
MKKNIVIGVGNMLFKDEGIGIYASEYIKQNYKFDDEDLEIIDGGTLGFKLMAYFQEYDNVIILDTVSIEDEVGGIYRLPSDVLLGLGNYRKTAHEVEIVEMLEIVSVLDSHANVTIIGIIPEDIISVEIGLTQKMEDKFEEFILNGIKEIESLGIKATKVDNIAISDVVKSMIGSYNGEHLNRIPNEEDFTHAINL